MSAPERAISTDAEGLGIPQLAPLLAEVGRLFERQLDDEAQPGGLSARIRRLARAMARP